MLGSIRADKAGFWPAYARRDKITEALSSLRLPTERTHEKVAMSDVLNVESRSEVGTKRNRRLRKTGRIPAVLYGHKEVVLNLAIRREEFVQVLRHGGKLVKLAGGASEDALVREVQWDTYGKNVLHVDLVRVSTSERASPPKFRWN